MGYILLLIAAAVGGAVSEICKLRNMTDNEYLEHERQFAARAKGIASGIVACTIGTTATVIKKSGGNK